MVRARRRGRGMEQERPHQQHVPLVGGCELFVDSITPYLVVRFPELPGAMRSWQDPHRSIVRTARIEMETQRHHCFEHGHRGLDMPDPGLLAPWPEPGGLNPVTHGDRQVLMPSDPPIRPGGLVEEDRTDGPRQDADGHARQTHRHGRHRPGANRGVIEKIPAPAPSRFDHLAERDPKIGRRGRTDDGTGECEPVRSEISCTRLGQRRTLTSPPLPPAPPVPAARPVPSGNGAARCRAGSRSGIEGCRAASRGSPRPALGASRATPRAT